MSKEINQVDIELDLDMRDLSYKVPDTLWAYCMA